MSLNWKRPRFTEWKEREKPLLREKKLVRLVVQWATRCTGCSQKLKPGVMVAYDPASKARFCARCVNQKEETVPGKVRRPQQQMKGPHLEVVNGQVRYVDDQEAATDTGPQGSGSGLRQ